jgi:hypothetical protein
MKDKVFSGEALEEALKSEELDQSEIELTGMVKSSDKPGHIAFARGGCDTWVDIPTKMIEQAEQLGRMPCKGHWHPQFRITLKKSNNPEARILSELLAKSPISFPSALSGPPGANAALAGARWGGEPPRMSGVAGANAALGGAISGGGPRRMSPVQQMAQVQQMARTIQATRGGGGVGGGGLGNEGLWGCRWHIWTYHCEDCIPWTDICWPDICIDGEIDCSGSF